jgi:hypothetical protein
MYNELAFVNDFIRAYPGYDRSDRSAAAIKLCFQTYQTSAKAELGALLIGRIERPATTGGGPPIIGIGDIERINFGTTGDREPGSVLWSKYWSPPLNDSWLMGGIHSGYPFYLASERSATNLLDKTFGVTVTGREIIGLMTFGYRINPNKLLGEVFECVDVTKARSATFQAYEAAVQAYKASGNTQQLLA